MEQPFPQTRPTPQILRPTPLQTVEITTGTVLIGLEEGSVDETHDTCWSTARSHVELVRMTLRIQSTGGYVNMSTNKTTKETVGFLLESNFLLTT